MFLTVIGFSTAGAIIIPSIDRIMFSISITMFLLYILFPTLGLSADQGFPRQTFNTSPPKDISI